MTIKKSVSINTSPSAVFEAATDWPGQQKWMVGTIVRPILNNGVGIGGSIEAQTNFGIFTMVDSMEITVWEPPYRCAVLHTGRIVRGSGLFEIQPITASTSLFIWSETLDIPFGILGRVGWILAQPFASFGIVWSLQRFKRWSERRNR